MTDNADHASRMKAMWSAVVLTAINDAIRHAARDKGRALNSLALWANSRDGRDVISMAGLDPSTRLTDCMVAFAAKGVTTTKSRKKGTKP